jgi:hypothetical protein
MYGLDLWELCSFMGYLLHFKNDLSANNFNYDALIYCFYIKL